MYEVVSGAGCNLVPISDAVPTFETNSRRHLPIGRARAQSSTAAGDRGMDCSFHPEPHAASVVLEHKMKTLLLSRELA